MPACRRAGGTWAEGLQQAGPEDHPLCVCVCVCVWVCVWQYIYIYLYINKLYIIYYKFIIYNFIIVYEGDGVEERESSCPLALLLGM